MLAFRTNLQNIYVTPKLVKKVIINLELPKMPGPDGILAVIMNNCEPELSNILAELFNMCLKETFFLRLLKVSSVVSVLEILGRALKTTTC